jgi:hypothetical protein
MKSKELKMISCNLNLYLVFFAGALTIFASSPMDRADAVVVGEVTAHSAGSLTLRVERSLKGTVSAGSSLTVSSPSLPASVTGRDPSGDFGIWLLQMSGPGKWAIVPDASVIPGVFFWAPLPKGSIPSASQISSSSAEDLVALELSSAIEQSESTGGSSYYFSQRLLDLPDSALVVGQYRYLSQSSNPGVHIVGLVGLVRQGDPKSLAELALPSEALRASPLAAKLASSFRRLRDGSPAVVGALGNLVTTAGVPSGVQLAAADTLRAIHTQATLPYLRSMLDSPNAEMRDHAIGGFSMFVQNLPVQTAEMVTDFSWAKASGPAPYRTQETDKYSTLKAPNLNQQQYVDFWKSWWLNVGSKLPVIATHP